MKVGSALFCRQRQQIIQLLFKIVHTKSISQTEKTEVGNQAKAGCAIPP
jgi:hypothetical protein